MGQKTFYKTLGGEIEFKKANSIQLSDFILIEGQPHRIIDIVKTKTRKLGIAQVAFTLVDLFAGQKIVHVYSTDDPILVPVVKTIDLEVVHISQDDFVSIITSDSTLKEDVKLPKNKKQANSLREIYQKNKDKSCVYFTIITVFDEERIVGARIENLQ